MTRRTCRECLSFRHSFIQLGLLDQSRSLSEFLFHFLRVAGDALEFRLVRCHKLLELSDLGTLITHRSHATRHRPALLKQASA